MGINSIMDVLFSIPKAIEGAYQVISGVSSEINNSCLFNVGKSLFKLQLPDISQVTCSVKEAKNIINLVQSEGAALQKKFRKVDEAEEHARVAHALQNAPNKEAYLQILSQDAAYLNLKEGTTLPLSHKFYCPEYKIGIVLEFPEGLKVMTFLPTEEGDEPLVVVRGTDPTNIHNVADDIVENIGEMNTGKYAEVLEDLLVNLATQYGRIHIMGHSYGGAVAERLTSLYPELIKRSTSHNSPGVGEKVVKIFKSKVAELSKYMEPPKIYSYRHAKDIFSLLGGSHLPADKAYTVGSTLDKISRIEAHHVNSLSTDAPVTENATVSPSLKKTALKIEKLRLQLSKAIPLYAAVQKVRGG